MLKLFIVQRSLSGWNLQEKNIAAKVGRGKLIIDFQGFKFVNTFFGDQPP